MKTPAKKQTRVIGIYKVRVGSLGQPTMLCDKEFTGVKRGDWIHLDEGGRKKASGNHIYWREIASEEEGIVNSYTV